jgi:hypothetical protein
LVCALQPLFGSIRECVEEMYLRHGRHRGRGGDTEQGK